MAITYVIPHEIFQKYCTSNSSGIVESENFFLRNLIRSAYFKTKLRGKYSYLENTTNSLKVFEHIQTIHRKYLRAYGEYAKKKFAVFS